MPSRPFGAPLDGRLSRKDVEVRRIEIDAESAADYEIAALAKLVGKTDARGKVFVVLRVDGVDPVALEDQAAFARNEDR